MRLARQITSRRSRPTAALALVAVLGLGGVSLAAVGTGGFDSLRDALFGTRGTHAPSFGISVKPAVRTVAAGKRATYPISIKQRKYRTRVRLRVVSRLPTGISARIAPKRGSSTRARLSLMTTTAVRPGTYRVSVRAFRGRPATPASARRNAASLRRWEHRVLGRRHMTKTVRLIVTAPRPAPPFTVGGQAARTLAPGVSSPIDVWVSNPHSAPLTIVSLSTSIARLDAQASGGAPACGRADFELRQFSGPDLVIPARATRKLSELGLPVGQWPQLTMLNRPVSQDGCKGAGLQLAFSAAGAGGAP